MDKDDMTTETPAPSESSEAGELYERHSKTLPFYELKREVRKLQELYPEPTAHLRPTVRGDCFKWRVICRTCGGSDEGRSDCHHCYGSGLEFMRLSVEGSSVEDRDPEEYQEWLKRREEGTEPEPTLRPCFFASCSHHLYLDVSRNEEGLTFYHPGKDLEDMKESCSLDVADRGGTTLEEVSEMLGVSRERIRQIEHKSTKALRRLPILKQMQQDGYVVDGPVDTRELWANNEGGVDTPKVVDPDQEWIDGVWRVYERMSREKALGLRPEFDVLPRKRAEKMEPAPMVEAAPEPPEEEEKVMPPKEPLTERQQIVLDAYLQCVRIVGGRPRPMDVALATGIELRKGAEAAMVNNALVAAIEKGYEVPHYDQPLPPLQKTPTPPRVPERIVQEKTPMQKAVAKKRVRPPSPKKRVRPPRKPVVYGDGMTPGTKEKDDFVKALLKKKEELMAELMAINLLLDRA